MMLWHVEGEVLGLDWNALVLYLQTTADCDCLLCTACYALHNFIRMYNRADEMFHVWEGSFVHNSDANPAGAARVGSGGTEEAFNSQAQ